MQARAKKPIYRQYKSAQTTQYFSGQNKIKKVEKKGRFMINIWYNITCSLEKHCGLV